MFASLSSVVADPWYLSCLMATDSAQNQLAQDTYFHGIDLNNFLPCWNLTLSGQLTSSEYSRFVDRDLANDGQSLRDTPLDSLKFPNPRIGVVTPRAAMVIAAGAIIRGGGHVGFGVQNTRWMSREQMDNILRLSDIEIAFEKTRRELFPDAASPSLLPLGS
jgi:hypothetical protein